jgi:molecular chaperone GrpE
MSNKNKTKDIDEQQAKIGNEEHHVSDFQTAGRQTEEEATSDLLQADLISKIEQLEKERDELKDKYLRKAAEFENYKRRIEQEFASLSKYANEQLIIDILPVVDDFERSLHVSKERREFGPFYKGIELIYRKFLKLLESKGVKQIDSEGKPFDVDLHDALMQISKENVAPNTVIEEVEKGYLYNDKVIRHAKVVVAKAPDADETHHEETSGEGPHKKENR